MASWERTDVRLRRARRRPGTAHPPATLALAWSRLAGAWCLPGQPLALGAGAGSVSLGGPFPSGPVARADQRGSLRMASAAVGPFRATTAATSVTIPAGQATERHTGLIDSEQTDIRPGDLGDEGSDAEDQSGDIEADHREVWRLVSAAQAGDGEAFGQLYDRYVDTVYRFLYYRVNDRALAEDFTSETFLRALRRISGVTYQGRDIGAWLITIARNIVLDHVKSARHRLEITTGEMFDGDEREPSPESAVLETLRSERLMEAVARLGDEQRECVTLRFIQGLSVSETAQAMGKNDGAVKALQHRAVRKLAELIGDELR